MLILVSVFGWRYVELKNRPVPARDISISDNSFETVRRRGIYEKPGAPKWDFMWDDKDKMPVQWRYIQNAEFPDGRVEIYSVKGQKWVEAPPGTYR